MLTFDPTPRGRKEVLKNKWTLVYRKEFYGESEKQNCLSPQELFFDQMWFLKKTILKN